MKNILLLTGFMFWGIWGGLHAQEWKSEHFQFKLEDSTLVYSQTVIITPNNLDSLLAAICETEEIGDIYPPRSYEKECVIKKAVEDGEILKSRYDSYLKFYEEAIK